LTFELTQMCYYINIEITKSSPYFLIFYTLIYYIINIKSAYKTLHENPYIRYAMIIHTHIEIRILYHCLYLYQTVDTVQRECIMLRSSL
jgi:hypothetical protein